MDILRQDAVSDARVGGNAASGVLHILGWVVAHGFNIRNAGGALHSGPAETTGPFKSFLRGCMQDSVIDRVIDAALIMTFSAKHLIQRNMEEIREGNKNANVRKTAPLPLGNGLHGHTDHLSQLCLG